MSLYKLRNLDKYGVITDVDPFNSPLGSWSMAINARFQDGAITSAPVWRGVSALSLPNPRFAYTVVVTSGASRTFVGYRSGNVAAWTPSLESDVTLSGYTANDVEATWSACRLADVVYINRYDRTPWALLPTGTRFIQAAGWNATHRAKILRAYNSALHAFNVTKNGVDYPTMIKSSDIVTSPGTQPPSWDETSTTNNAAENILTEMNGDIVDAVPFGSVMLIYSNSEVWEMRANATSEIYGYRQLPFNSGVIAPNCVVTVANKQYGFGPEDIWVHDGSQQVSICSGTTRKFIFASLNAKRANQFFVTHDASHKTISFHYVSGDAYVSFQGAGCNRAAVWNYENSTWTFDDLPLVFSAVYGNFSLTTQSWTNTTLSWDTVGGSWQDLEDGFKRAPLYLGDDAPAHGLSRKVYVRDNYGAGSVASLSVDEAATKGFLIERSGLDLDDLGAEYRDYKHIRAIYPQGRLDDTAKPVAISLGVTDYSDDMADYQPSQTWNARDLYWCDFDSGGRFLSIKLTYDDYRTMSLTGFDIDIEVTGSR